MNEFLGEAGLSLRARYIGSRVEWHGLCEYAPCAAIAKHRTAWKERQTVTTVRLCPECLERLVRISVEYR